MNEFHISRSDSLAPSLNIDFSSSSTDRCNENRNIFLLFTRFVFSSFFVSYIYIFLHSFRLLHALHFFLFLFSFYCSLSFFLFHSLSVFSDPILQSSLIVFILTPSNHHSFVFAVFRFFLSLYFRRLSHH